MSQGKLGIFGYLDNGGIAGTKVIGVIKGTGGKKRLG